MGFDLNFHKISKSKDIGADKEGIKNFLNTRNLTIADDGESFLDEHGQSLAFNHHFSDIYLSGFNNDEPINGGIHHATLTIEECDFIFDLCVAGKMMIFNPQGYPTYIFIQDFHSFADLALNAEDESIQGDFVTIQSGLELQLILSKGFDEFQNWLEKVKDSYK